MHGDESGSVDRKHNLHGGRLVEADPQRVAAERRQMEQPPYCMDRSRREAVLAALVERCSERHWSLTAAHVRTNRVHSVVDAEAEPARIMNDVICEPMSDRLGMDAPGRKRWARHGSTRWLWKPQERAGGDSVCCGRAGRLSDGRLRGFRSLAITAPFGRGSAGRDIANSIIFRLPRIAGVILRCGKTQAAHTGTGACLRARADRHFRFCLQGRPAGAADPFGERAHPPVDVHPVHRPHAPCPRPAAVPGHRDSAGTA